MNRRGIIWFICFSAIGVLYQSISLAAFMFVARTGFAYVGKPLVVAAAVLTTALLLWIWIRSMHETIWLILAPVALAVGYSVAYLLVGVLFFPVLLGDFYPPFLDYALAVLRVTGIAFVMFGLGTVSLVFLDRLMARLCRPTWLNPESPEPPTLLESLSQDPLQTRPQSSYSSSSGGTPI
ncbi:MAG: hypothetical protein ABR976_17235 [Terracidiphilus sp.]|jgi:hypothetical protein